jgi:hypothetical protein
MKLCEKFLDGQDIQSKFHREKKYYEFFINPTVKELEAAQDGGADSCRGVILKTGDIVIWSCGMHLIHAEAVMALTNSGAIKTKKMSGLNDWKDRDFITIEISPFKEVYLGESEDWALEQYGDRTITFKKSLKNTILSAKEKNPKLKFGESFFVEIKSAYGLDMDLKEDSKDLLRFLIDN